MSSQQGFIPILLVFIIFIVACGGGKSIESLAGIQGEYMKDVKTVTNNYHVEYTQIVDKILQTACSNCKPKFLQNLKPIIKKDEK